MPPKKRGRPGAKTGAAKQGSTTTASKGASKYVAHPPRRPGTRSTGLAQEEDKQDVPTDTITMSNAELKDLLKETALQASKDTANQMEMEFKNKQDTPNDTVTLTNAQLKDLLKETAQEATQSTLNELKSAGLIKDTAQSSQKGADSAIIKDNTSEEIIKDTSGAGLGSVKAFTDKLLEGENSELDTNNITADPPQIQYNMGIALDMHVPSNLRAKIHNKEFVYFSDLLYKNRERSHSNVQISKQTGQVVVENKPSKITGIDQWNEAFNIFCTIYCKKFPTEVADLLKHASTVRRIHSKGGDWLWYDTQMRLFIQNTGCKWSLFNTELYTDAMINANFRDKTSHSSKNSFRTNKSTNNKKFPLQEIFEAS